MNRTKADNNNPIMQAAIQALEDALGSDLIAVVLYGSRSRGEAQVTSDWDMLVVATNLPQEALARHFLLKRALPVEHRSAISLLARTPHELKASLPSIYLDIALDGQILYDPQGVAASHLAGIRQHIKHRGLLRQRTRAGDLWVRQSSQPTAASLALGD